MSTIDETRRVLDTQGDEEEQVIEVGPDGTVTLPDGRPQGGKRTVLRDSKGEY